VWSLFQKHNLVAKMPPPLGRVVLLERDELEEAVHVGLGDDLPREAELEEGMKATAAT
jgi:hypothetical protein